MVSAVVAVLRRRPCSIPPPPPSPPATSSNCNTGLGWHCLWAFYLGWMVPLYAVAILTSVYGYCILKRGLDETQERRHRVAAATVTCAIVYTCYLSLLGVGGIMYEVTRRRASLYVRRTMLLLLRLRARGWCCSSASR